MADSNEVMAGFLLFDYFASLFFDNQRIDISGWSTQTTIMISATQRWLLDPLLPRLVGPGCTAADCGAWSLDPGVGHAVGSGSPFTRLSQITGRQPGTE
jgi:hypothetical protein